tara:strand:- start:33446 stop:34138 length:693 start_codon:yes stop_codon:yes gene_type:complete
MKSFLKEIESKFKEINERDWDEDGEQESPRDEYMGVKDKAIKKAMKKEDAKPDFLDLDDDGDTEEDMKDAANEVIKTDDEQKALELQKQDPEADIELTEDEIDEMSTTGGVPGYQTPNAFSTRAQAKKKKKMKYESVQKAMDAKYAALIESYSKFASGNPKSTPTQTVNGTIKEVAKKLQEIEKLVRYTSRLKNESGIAGSTYGKSTHNALNKISERLLKISERIRSLGE